MRAPSLAVLALAAAALPLGAQTSTAGSAAAGPRLGILAGANLATIGGDEVEGADRRVGFVGGIYARLPLGTTGALSLRPELLYSQKGAKGAFGDDEDIGGSASLRLTYVDVPILLQLDVAPSGASSVRPHLYAGPAFGLRTGCTLSGSAGGISVSVDCEQAAEGEDVEFKRFELSGIVGAGLGFGVAGRAVTVGARYQHGFSDIVDGSGIRNRVLALYGSIELPFSRR
jgi:hypothetical protein